jgi:hypothetical protein
MRTFKWLIASAIFVILSINSVLASSNRVLDTEEAANKSISNSANIKAIDNFSTSLERSKKDANKASDDIRKRLRNSDILSDTLLKNYLELDKGTQFYTDILIRMHSIMTEDDEYQAIKVRDLYPINIEYTIASNQRQRSVAEKGAKLSAYIQSYNIFKIRDTIDLQTKLLNNLKSTFDTANLKYKNGQISKIELQMIEINLKKVKLQLQILGRNMDSATVMLNKTTAENLSTRYTEYKGDNRIPDINLKPLDYYLTSALENRSEILSADENYKLKKLEYEITEQIYKDELNMNRRNANQSMNEAKNNLDKTKIDIQLELTAAYKELEKKINTLYQYDETYLTDKTNFDNDQKRYKLGLISEKDIVDKSIFLTESQIKIRSLQYDILIDLFKMDYASNLGPGIAPQSASIGGNI